MDEKNIVIHITINKQIPFSLTILKIWIYYTNINWLDME